MLKSAKFTQRQLNNIDFAVSKRLKIKRLELGLTQKDLSKAIDVSIQQITKYESGTNRISSGNLYLLAKFLRVPVNYFFQTISM